MPITVGKAYEAWQGDKNERTEGALWVAIEKEVNRLTSKSCILQGLPSQEVEDIAGAVMVSIIEAWPKYEARRSPIAAWLGMVAGQRITDEIMAWKRRDCAVELKEDSLVDLSTQIVTIVAINQSTVIEGLFKDLSEEERTFVYLKFWHGYSERELELYFDKARQGWAHDRWQYLRGKMKLSGDELEKP